MFRKILPLLLGLLSCACVGPTREHATAASKPGWGRGYTPAERELSVRAVPASLQPTAPGPRLGKPGWGRED